MGSLMTSDRCPREPPPEDEACEDVENASCNAFKNIGNVEPKWLADCLGTAEHCRRVLALHQVCAKLLQLHPQNRPRSLEALKRSLRNTLTVKTYTLHPVALATALEAPTNVQDLLLFAQGGCASDMMESIDSVQETLHLLYSRWIIFKKRVGCNAMAAWISSQACVKREYEVKDVVSVLEHWGMLRCDSHGSIDCSGITHESCSSSLPPNIGLANLPWNVIFNGSTSTKRHVCLPPGIFGMVIGKQGKAIKDLRDKLTNNMPAPRWGIPGDVPLVLLKATRSSKCEPGVLTLTFRWKMPWQSTCEPEQVKCLADAVAHAALLHVNELYRKRLNRMFLRHEQRKKRLQKIGQLYHTRRRNERRERLHRPFGALERALTLPKPGSSVSHFGGRKELMRHRRRAAAREKRKILLRSWASLGFLNPLGSKDRWSLVEGVHVETEVQKRCEQLMESQYLARLCRPHGQRRDERILDGILGGANRLQQQIKAVADVGGVSYVTSTKPKGRSSKSQPKFGGSRQGRSTLKSRKSQPKFGGSCHSVMQVTDLDF